MRFSWRDLLDIVIVSFVLYRLFLLIKGTRAVQLLRGLIVLLVFYYAVDWFELRTIKFLMQNAGMMIIVAIPIVFQPEMRRALAHLGQGRGFFSTDPAFTKGKDFFAMIDTLVDTAKQLSSRRIGALIAIERETGLNEFAETGTRLDADLSRELLMALFHTNSPLHDGAVIVRGTKLFAAGAVLPLTESFRSSLSPRQHLGTRHRAAQGLAESSDAICMVVSEETGDISLAVGTQLHRHLSEESLHKLLLKHLQAEAKATATLPPLFRGLARKDG